MMKTKLQKGNLLSKKHKRTWKSAWREIGGIKKYYRSRWEANYAYYLEFLLRKGLIKRWLHEPKTFWFEKIKRGTRSYTPDFEILNLNDEIEYHEVKGWMDPASKTKIKRMRIYHKDVKLVVIEKKQYDEIKQKLSRIIDGWEN